MMKKISRKARTVILLVVLVVCFVFLRSSFAYYELKEEIGDAIVLETLDLNYTFTNLGANNTVTIPASGEREITITLNTQNPIEMKYQLYYLVQNSSDFSGDELASLRVNLSPDSKDEPTGTVVQSSPKEITLILKNPTSKDVVYQIGAQGGLMNQELVLEQGKPIVLINYLRSVTYEEGGNTYLTSDAFWGYRDKITNVSFLTTTTPPTSYTESFDVSDAQNNSIIAYLIPNENSDTYRVTIQADGKIYLNQNGNSLFENFVLLETIDGLNNLDTSKTTTMRHMFSSCNNLISLDLSSFDTSHVTEMQLMFYRCQKLTEVNLSSFDTSQVTNMNNMFYNCRNLTNLNLSSFVTSKVTRMDYMFQGCTNLVELNINNFDTSQVTTMQNMFYECNKISTLNLNHFNTSNVTAMAGMFARCRELVSLSIDNFDTQNVNNMVNMFESCEKLTTLNLKSFNTSNVTEMGGMFAFCYELQSLDLSSFDTSKVTNVYRMLAYCRSLTSLDLRNANFNSVTNSTEMLLGISPTVQITVMDNTMKSFIENLLEDGRGTVVVA